MLDFGDGLSHTLFDEPGYMDARPKRKRSGGQL
jgi:hypothetical protein